MATQTTIISNRPFIDNDTSERIDKYIDEICSNPDFLCKNKELCGTSTSLYSDIKNVNDICDNIVESNKCENDIEQCVVSANNTFGDDKAMVTTSFVNIIVPIKDVIDEYGNQKFLRLPPLSSSKSKDSEQACKICACMERFSKSPGSSGNNTDTSPGQNQCSYPSTFEYYYYPLNLEEINNKLKDYPPVIIGKYKIINSNIIYANSSEDLLVTNLYDLLIRNNVSKFNAVNFITKVLYKDDKIKNKILELYILNKNESNEKNNKAGIFYKNITSYFIIFVIFIIFIFFNKVV